MIKFKQMVNRFNYNTILGSIKVKFPQELKATNKPAASCYKINSGISSNSLCEISNSILTITNCFPTNLQKDTVISFEIDNIQNYNVVIPSSSFEISTLTQNQYLIGKVSSNLIVYFSPGDLLNVKVTPSSLTTYNTSNYVIEFQTTNDLPINSKIKILLPTELAIDDLISSNLTNTIMDSVTNKIQTGLCNIDFDTTLKLNVITCSKYNTTSKINGSTIMTIKLFNIRNPRSLKKSSSFTISTYTSENFLIDSKNSQITIQLTESASIKNIIVTPTSNIVGENTDYLVEVYPITKIITNDILIIAFPSQIKPTSSLSIISKDNLEDNMQFEKVNNADGTTTLKITLFVKNGSLFNTKFALSFQNIKNPPSTKTTNSITFKIVTIDSFEIEKYNSNKTIQMITPGIISNTVVKALVDQIGSVSDYNIQLMPSNYIPKDGFIIIKYPTQVIIIYLNILIRFQ